MYALMYTTVKVSFLVYYNELMYTYNIFYIIFLYTILLNFVTNAIASNSVHLRELKIFIRSFVTPVNYVYITV